MTSQEIFDTGLMYHHYANTAYPLTPGSFREYRVGDSEGIAAVLRGDRRKPETGGRILQTWARSAGLDHLLRLLR